MMPNGNMRFCLFSRSFFSLAAPFKTPLFLPFAGVFQELKLNSRSKCQYARPNTSGPLPRRARGGVVEKAHFWSCTSGSRAGFFLFDGPGGAMGIDSFLFALGLTFRASARFFFFGIFGVFLGYFLVFLFFCFFLFFRALARFFFFLFRRGREQNREFPL